MAGGGAAERKGGSPQTRPARGPCTSQVLQAGTGEAQGKAASNIKTSWVYQHGAFHSLRDLRDT